MDNSSKQTQCNPAAHLELRSPKSFRYECASSSHRRNSNQSVSFYLSVRRRRELTYTWSISGRERNRRAHSLNGNTTIKNPHRKEVQLVKAAIDLGLQQVAIPVIRQNIGKDRRQLKSNNEVRRRVGEIREGTKEASARSKEKNKERRNRQKSKTVNAQAAVELERLVLAGERAPPPPPHVGMLQPGDGDGAGPELPEEVEEDAIIPPPAPEQFEFQDIPAPPYIPGPQDLPFEGFQGSLIYDITTKIVVPDMDKQIKFWFYIFFVFSAGVIVLSDWKWALHLFGGYFSFAFAIAANSVVQFIQSFGKFSIRHRGYFTAVHLRGRTDLRSDVHAMMDLRHENRDLATVTHVTSVCGFILRTKDFHVHPELLSQIAQPRFLTLDADSTTVYSRLNQAAKSSQTCNFDRYDALRRCYPAQHTVQVASYIFQDMKQGLDWAPMPSDF